MEGITKSVEVSKEAIEVFSQLQHGISQLVFEMKKWISNCNEV